jgi:cellulose synthase/poly-beta-1,6-N-acetylglucosamine synthase-like glycosyltransferase
MPLSGDTGPLVLLGVSFGLLLYTYGGYPGLLWALGRWKESDGGDPGEPPAWPAVSIVTSAYNEEQVIADRIRNLLALDYPGDRLEILVGSDGSTDRTCAIVEPYEAQGVRLVTFPNRRGKASVVNDLVARARGEIVVMTDANTFFYPDAVRELVRALGGRPSACAVVGCVDVRSSVATGNLDGSYWRYETRMKILESRFGSVLGANGPIYAFRRARYQPLPEDAIVDDLLIPMLMQLRTGGQVFFVPSARARETSPGGLRDEFRRRVRIGAGNCQALVLTWRLLLPGRGMVALAYFSHKLLRWLAPWLMLVALGANLGLLHRPVFRGLLVVQLALYGLGLGATVVRRVPLLGAIAAGLRFFLVLNAALLLGFVRFALGRARPVWSPSPRGSELPGR